MKSAHVKSAHVKSAYVKSPIKQPPLQHRPTTPKNLLSPMTPGGSHTAGKVAFPDAVYLDWLVECFG